MPNVFMLVQENRVEWISLRPIAVDQSEITVTTLIPCNEDLTTKKRTPIGRKIIISPI